jgi:hypothetical protein
MWERTPTSWWKIVGPGGAVVVVSVSKPDADFIVKATEAYSANREGE